MSNQPQWEFVANLGDASPIDYGGLFVFRDTTGVYSPEMEKLERLNDSDHSKFDVYRVVIEPCTFIDGILSDNKFHPGHAAWFAKPEFLRKDRPQDTTYLSNITSTFGTTTDELVAMFVSDDILQRAKAWRMVFDYHGWENGDSYPLRLKLFEVKKRYKDIL